MNTTHRRASLIALSTSLALASAAQAQWTYINLHPAGANSSEARGVDGQHVVGSVQYDGSVIRPSLWTGTSTAWTDLKPVSIFGAEAFGIGGGQQVGTIDRNIQPRLIRPRAVVWAGTANSYIDLNPDLASAGSVARGAGGGQQVGYILVGILSTPDALAALWTGSAASFVNLHPSGAQHSFAYGTDGVQQVGLVLPSNQSSESTGRRAALWSGTAASFVGLHPAGAIESEARAVSGGQQVGWTRLTLDGYSEASLWTGTAASFVNLNPLGATSSTAASVAGGMQVGWAFLPDASGDTGTQRASQWHGTAESWVDLHSFLPGTFESSEATGIWTDGITVRISGWGINTATPGGRIEAILWTRTLCIADTDDGTGTGTPDGGVTVDDLIHYLSTFEAGLVAADVNNGSGTGTPDNAVDINDLLFFLARFEAGC